VRRFLEHELHGASSPHWPPIASHNRSEAMSPPAHIAKSITWITLWFMDVNGGYNMI
jgi:hypothetical protein